jgi:hypothetical protein
MRVIPETTFTDKDTKAAFGHLPMSQVHVMLQTARLNPGVPVVTDRRPEDGPGKLSITFQSEPGPGWVIAHIDGHKKRAKSDA